MKRFNTIIILFFVSTYLFSQSGFSYQGVLRNESGKLRTSETIELTASLIKGDSAMYSETHQVVTNSYGVFSIVIGNGVSSTEYSSDLFLNSDSTSINTIYLEVKEGSKVLSKTQILGVPFAEVAKVALKAHIEFPAGSIIAFGGDTSRIPRGWLLCNGKGYDKTLYPDLFAAIGSNWGTDGELFRVPDLRGSFLRGVNYDASDAAFNDPDNTSRTYRHGGGNIGNQVGSYQEDQLVSHQHSITMYKGHRESGGYNDVWLDTYDSGLKYTNYTGGSETRPVNAYVNYIIKY